MNDLLEKYFTGQLSDEEKTILFKQIDADSVLRTEFVRWQNVYAVSGMAETDRDLSYVRQQYQKIMAEIAKRKAKRTYLTILKYAAVIVLLLSSWFLSRIVMTDPVEEYTSIEVPKGQQIHVTLPDNSEIWLSSRSQLKFSNRFNEKNRNIELNGEAFLSVKKDTHHPFIVRTSKYDVKVTGTQFNVFAYAESPMFETDLVEGAVSVYKETDEKEYPLKSKEKLVLENGVLIKESSDFMETHYVKNGIYAFESKTVREIADRLELWYDVKITIKDSTVANSVIRGKFRQTDYIDNILKAIKETGRFNYKLIDDNNVELYE